MDIEAALQIFLEEADELLHRMEESLLGLEGAPDSRARIDEIFRAAHTIKGTAGVFGFDLVVAFTHDVESVLERMRSGELQAGADCIGLLLRSKDHIGVLVNCVGEGVTPSPAALAAGGEITAGLRSVLAGHGGAVQPVASQSVAPPSDGPQKRERWFVGVRFGVNVLRGGMDPLSFLRFLLTLGEPEAVRLRDKLPVWAEFDPESCYTGFDVVLCSEAARTEIEGAFEFVRDDCVLGVLPVGAPAAELQAVAASLDGDPACLLAWLVEHGASVEQAAEERTEAIALQLADGPRAGASATPVARESRSLRVDADKLDRLIELVGELVVASAGVQNVSLHLSEPRLLEANEVLARLVEEVRDQALLLRMVPIGPTFQRFQRVVRDVSRELGKDIELCINGADTELDKTVVERIGDPLMHLVRNAMDHGIESIETRRASGKPARAHITLDAHHEAGGILLTVSDDGGGLNRTKILAKAVERGLVAPDAVLSERDIDRLIFEPGFSTADQISNLSGRGVGMDVVRRDIEALRGTVDIESSPGAGTRIRIRLPLTLAIIDGFLIGIGDARFVLPVDLIVECVELAGTVRQHAHNRGYLDLRGEVLPLIWLRDLFDMPGETPERRENIVVVHFGTQKVGLVVDQLIGEHQTVIRPLGSMFRALRGVGGSTILGNGDIALVLDLADLTQFAADSMRHAEHQPVPATH